MTDAFVEGVRSIVQVCHLVILAPVALTIVAARGRAEAVAGAVVGVVVGGWVFAAGWITLSDLALRLSAVLLVAAVLILGTPQLFGRDEIVRHAAGRAGIAFGVGALVAQWWRPCVGQELGSILTDAPDRPWSQLLPTAGFMVGISLPVIAIGLLYAAWSPGPTAAARLGRIATALTAVLGLSVMVGRHGEIVARLFEWSQ